MEPQNDGRTAEAAVVLGAECGSARDSESLGGAVLGDPTCNWAFFFFPRMS